jgi:hypothetical protein
MLGLGCPTFADALFPPADAKEKPQIVIANGKMLVHLIKFADQLVLPGNIISVGFERVCLKTELQSLTKSA